MPVSPTTRASAARTWDDQAGSYARQEHLEVRAIDAALQLAGIAAEDRLVDLATGTGLLLRRLAAAEIRPRTAIGVDRSAGMLAQIGPLPEGWSTILADAGDVPLRDGSADVVTCAYLLQVLDPVARRAALAEARRLLVAGPRSRLVVVTPWADDRRVGGRIVSAAFTLLARRAPGRWGGLLPVDPTGDLLGAGFVVTRRRVVPRNGYPSLVLVCHARRTATAATPDRRRSQ